MSTDRMPDDRRQPASVGSRAAFRIVVLLMLMLIGLIAVQLFTEAFASYSVPSTSAPNTHQALLP